MTPIKETLRYKNMVANLKSRPLYVKEAALLKEIAGGKQWRMDAVMDAIGPEPKDWRALTHFKGFPKYMVRRILEQAATFGRLDTMKTLCKRMSFETSAPTEEFIRSIDVHHAFEYAMINGHYKVADYLAKSCGARPGMDLMGAPSAMTISLAEGNRKKIDLLLDYGSDLALALSIGILKADKGTIEYLVSKGADVNYMQDSDVNPFSLAVTSKRNDIAHYLLSKGAEPQKSPNAGEMLNTAIGDKNAEMVKTLLKIGIRPIEYDLEYARFKSTKEIIDMIEPLVAKKDAPRAPRPV